MSEDYESAYESAPAPAAVPAPRPSALPGMLIGCGGCGCLFNFIALVAGIIIIVIGVDEREEELQVAGAITVGAALLFAIGALILLIVGFVKNKSLKADFERHERAAR